MVSRLVIIITLMIIVLITISSCSYILRNYYDYKYIVLIDNSIEKSSLLVMPKKSHLSNYKAIPAFYSLKRSSFTVTFTPDLTSAHPAMYLKAEDNNGNLLTIHGEKLKCGGFYQFTYDKNGKKIGRKKIIRYVWKPSFACRESKSKVEEQKIIFQIIGNNGELVAKEIILFELKRNGKYYEVDAL